MDFTENAALEFHVYSSEGRGRRHLLGVCSILLKEVDNLTDGKANLSLIPQTVFRVSASALYFYFSHQESLQPVHFWTMLNKRYKKWKTYILGDVEQEPHSPQK